MSSEITYSPPVEWRTPHMRVRFRHRIGKLEMEIDFTLTQPWTVLVGPSGSGKTTILRVIAGLLKPKDVSISYIPQTIWPPKTEPAPPNLLADSAGCVWIPPHKRRMAMSTQSSDLFPHLTVRQNLRYANPGGRPEEWILQEERLERVLDRFRISHLADNSAASLSGGEARRVSLARAVLAFHRYLLVDEPFTGVQAELRDELIEGLRESSQDIMRPPVLSVTHDVTEAFQLGAEVIKIADGKVVAQGPVEVVLAEEREQLLKQLQADRQSPSTI